VDIRVQYPKAYGFEMSPRLEVRRFELPIKEYILYQNVQEDPIRLQTYNEKYPDVLGSSGNILFGVNLDLIDIH
jgi:hypothetical protein